MRKTRRNTTRHDESPFSAAGGRNSDVMVALSALSEPSSLGTVEKEEEEMKEEEGAHVQS